MQKKMMFVNVKFITKLKLIMIFNSSDLDCND